MCNTGSLLVLALDGEADQRRGGEVEGFSTSQPHLETPAPEGDARPLFHRDISSVREEKK